MISGDLFRDLAKAEDHEAVGKILRRYSIDQLRSAFAAAAGPTSKEVTVYIDGACRGNPGPMGAGVVVRDKAGIILSRRSKSLGQGTNNRAEYHALIMGLKEAARLGATKVQILTDSALLANQMTSSYRIKDKTLGLMASEALKLMRAFKEVSFKAIPRSENGLADDLAKTAVSGENR